MFLPPALTMTAPSVPPAALTDTPRSGRTLVAPLAGVIVPVAAWAALRASTASPPDAAEDVVAPEPAATRPVNSNEPARRAPVEWGMTRTCPTSGRPTQTVALPRADRPIGQITGAQHRPGRSNDITVI